VQVHAPHQRQWSAAGAGELDQPDTVGSGCPPAHLAATALNGRCSRHQLRYCRSASRGRQAPVFWAQQQGLQDGMMPTQLLQVGERQQQCARVPQFCAALGCPRVYLQRSYGCMYQSSLMKCCLQQALQHGFMLPTICCTATAAVCLVGRWQLMCAQQWRGWLHLQQHALCFECTAAAPSVCRPDTASTAAGACWPGCRHHSGH
jgi:hypothetical protein